MNDKLSVPPTTSSPASLKVVEPQTLLEHMNEVYDSIAQRAFAFFERDGGVPGRDRDHWLKAEEELLHPVHVKIENADSALTVKAEVPGFEADDLQVSLEPSRLTIGGKKAHQERRKDGETVYEEQCSSEILRIIDLPAEVDATKAAATLKNGILELKLPKQAGARSTQASAKAASA